VSSVYSQKVTACFISASVAIPLPASALKELKERYTTGHKIRAVGRVVHQLPPIRPKASKTGGVGLCDIPPVSHLNGSWLASSLKQMPM
jgi:hypothetical protein